MRTAHMLREQNRKMEHCIETDETSGLEPRSLYSVIMDTKGYELQFVGRGTG